MKKAIIETDNGNIFYKEYYLCLIRTVGRGTGL